MIKETLILLNFILLIICYRKIKQIEQLRNFLKEWKNFKARNGE